MDILHAYSIMLEKTYFECIRCMCRAHRTRTVYHLLFFTHLFFAQQPSMVLIFF